MLDLPVSTNRDRLQPMTSQRTLVQAASATVVALVICLLPLSPIYATNSDEASSKPNIVFIITDDQGYGDVRFHGNTMIQTPTIDSLAKQSLRLTNFHVEPTCAETRAALMSGQFPLRVGVWHTIMGRSILSPDAVTMPQLFQAAGYRTGMFGKWHLGDNYPYRPQDRGFEVTLHHGGGGVGQTPDVWGNDYFDDVYWSSSELRPVRGYCTDVFFEAAMQFISQEKDQPFFCYLATNAPHGPYLVDESYKKPYLEQGVAEPMASFYGMITNIDDNLSRLLALLDEQQLARETIVVFMTDNGTAAGYRPRAQQADSPWSGFNAGMRGTKGQQYDGGHRVPCFIRFPDGRHADEQFGSLTAHVDLLPTLASLCDVDTSDAGHLDGHDLGPFIAGEADVEPRTLIVQSHRVEAPRKWIKSATMTDSWRLIDGRQLYAIDRDPGQQRDVAADHPDVVRRLRAAYEDWWSDCAPAPEEYSRIPLGHPAAERVCLTAHDWHGPTPPWNQRAINNAPKTNGYWEIRVEQDGAYQFLLSRRPLEEPAPLGCEQVSLQIGSQAKTIAVDPSSVLAPITLQLETGDYRLSSRLLGDGLGNTGAFYVYAHYLGQATPDEKSLPDWLMPGDRVAWLGGTLIERTQEFGTLEAEWLARAPLAGLTFCNLGWSGDDIRGRARAVFGAPEEGKARREKDLATAAPSLVVIAYGMSEALGDAISETTFREELSALIDAQQAAGRRAVVCRIPGLELDSLTASTGVSWKKILPHYQNRRQQLNRVIDQVAGSDVEIAVIDLPDLKTSWFESAQYLSGSGYAQWNRDWAESVLGPVRPVASDCIGPLSVLSREANRLFFEMHRPQNETYLYLFRKHEQGNNSVEPFQNRPLLAERQLKMLFMAARGEE